MDNKYYALYRERDDNDWDLMVVLGLDAEPADTLFKLGQDYFGGIGAVFMIIASESDKDFPDVYDASPIKLSVENEGKMLAHEEKWPESTRAIEWEEVLENAHSSDVLIEIDGREITLLIPNYIPNEYTRVIYNPRSRRVTVIHDKGNGWWAEVASGKYSKKKNG